MSLREETIADLRAWFLAIQTGWPGFARRQAQDRMVMAIAAQLEQLPDKAIEKGSDLTPVAPLAIDAPTGVGKSLAYLIPALAAVQRRPWLKLIISTATVALQAQLLRDLAALAAVAPAPFKSQVLKGRGRYVCDRNLVILAGSDMAQGSLGLGDEGHAAWPFQPDPAEAQAVDRMLAARQGAVAERWDGDLDHWAEVLPARTAPLVTTSSSACAGQACRHYATCPFVLARRGWAEAQVLVVNHALLLADAALGGGAVLPDLGKAVLVMDEAHRLPEVAIEAAAGRLLLSGAAKSTKDSMTALARAERACGKTPGESKLDRRSEALATVVEGLSKLDPMVRAKLPADGGSAKSQRSRYGRIYGQPVQVDLLAGDLSVLDRLGDLAAAAGVLQGQLTAGLEQLAEAAEAGKLQAPVAAKLTRQLGEAHGQLAALEKVAGLLRAIQAGRPGAAWLERDGKGEVILRASPLEASGWLASRIWSKAAAAVATSATLQAMGSFAHFLGETGLAQVDGHRALALPSPFDLAGRVRLAVPRMGVLPKDDQAFLRRALDLLGSRVDPSEATLVLCASRALMLALHAGLPPALKAVARLQGERPLATLLADHALVVGQGEGSLLMGLATLAEGVDLPGDLCRHVVLVKLPFGTPDDPLARARARWFEAEGRSLFGEQVLPDTHRRLVQSCGRLIRSMTDSGRITLLDDRLLDTAWGRRMVALLPPYGREANAGQAGKVKDAGQTPAKGQVPAAAG